MVVSIVVPTYNEKDNLDGLVRAILQQRMPTVTRVCIVIVDDNSPDGTGRIADDLAQEFPGQIIPVHRMHEKGRASAGIAGFRRCLAEADCTHIVEMDADFSHHPDDLPALVAGAARADVVVGSRYISGGKAINCRSFNRLLSIAINVVNRVLLGVPVIDSSGGYKVYARRVMETIDLGNYVSTAYSVGVETLLKCLRHGFTFHEVPITFRNRERGNSKMDWKVIREYPRTLIALKMLDLRGKVK